MSKVILSFLIATLGSASALADPLHDDANDPPPSVGCMPNVSKQDSDTGSGLDKQVSPGCEHRTDYAARLRASFQGEAREALISREVAMGAAAEIEHLWAALWAMVDETKDAHSPHYITWVKAIAALAEDERN